MSKPPDFLLLRPHGFSPRDLNLLGRLRSGQPVYEAEIGMASDVFRPIAGRIHAAPVADRPALIEAWLRSCAESQAIAPLEVEVALSGPPQPLQAVPIAATGPAPTAADDGLDGDPMFGCATDVTARPMAWLWRGRVPMNAVGLFAGDPKLGKSFVTLSLAAAVSRGAAMPDGDIPDGPASVLIMSAEDDTSTTIVPRLKAAGADISRIHFFYAVRMKKSGIIVAPRLDYHLPHIESVIAGLGDCRLLLIDPVTAYLGGIDDHRNSDLRGLILLMKTVAEQHRTAILLVTHLSKSAVTNGKHRVMGSMAYVGACRSNVIFIRDRSDPSGRRVLICDNGGNLAHSTPTLAYAIEDGDEGPRVVFQHETLAITAEQALIDEMNGGLGKSQAPERREAEIWLREVLAAGPLLVREIEETARASGISKTMLRRARESLEVASSRSGFGKGAVYSWALPQKPHGEA